MGQIDVKCPICGSMNEGVDLEETEGWMECNHCKAVCVPPMYMCKFLSRQIDLKNIPIYEMDNAVKALSK